MQNKPQVALVRTLWTWLRRQGYTHPGDSTTYPHFAGPLLQQLSEGPQEAADGGGADRQAAGQEGRAARPGSAEWTVSHYFKADWDNFF